MTRAENTTYGLRDASLGPDIIDHHGLFSGNANRLPGLHAILAHRRVEGPEGTHRHCQAFLVWSTLVAARTAVLMCQGTGGEGGAGRSQLASARDAQGRCVAHREYSGCRYQCDMQV